MGATLRLIGDNIESISSYNIISVSYIDCYLLNVPYSASPPRAEELAEDTVSRWTASRSRNSTPINRKIKASKQRTHYTSAKVYAPAARVACVITRTKNVHEELVTARRGDFHTTHYRNIRWKTNFTTTPPYWNKSNFSLFQYKGICASTIV